MAGYARQLCRLSLILAGHEVLCGFEGWHLGRAHKHQAVLRLLQWGLDV